MSSSLSVPFQIAAWYDSDLKTYQKDRQDGGELQRRFEDPSRQAQSDNAAEFFTKKSVVETETEWQRQVKNKKNDDYYKILKQVDVCRFQIRR